MKAVLSRIRERLSFANVTSLLALFVALGGTGYAAIALPTDSVGASQIRSGAVGTSEVRSGAVAKSEVRTGAVGKSEIATNAVGASEVRRGAIDTTELSDAGVELADLTATARAALTDASAVTFTVAATAAGAAAGGNAKSVTRSAPGEYTVELTRDVHACQYAATLQQAGAGLITAVPAAENPKVVVRTFNPDGTPVDAPFHVLIAC